MIALHVPVKKRCTILMEQFVFRVSENFQARHLTFNVDLIDPMNFTVIEIERVGLNVHIIKSDGLILSEIKV